MRKLKLTQACVALPMGVLSILSALQVKVTLIAIFSLFIYQLATGQCGAGSTEIHLQSFVDENVDGLFSQEESTAAGILFTLYDEAGNVAAEATSDENPWLVIDGLSSGATYRVEASVPSPYTYGMVGGDAATAVQFVTAGSCSSISVLNPDLYCGIENPALAVSCFVKGGDGVNEDIETVVSTEYQFVPSSGMAKWASKKETGAVWGLAWSATAQKLFTAAILKQDAQLGPAGLGGIYASRETESGFETQLFTNLEALGFDLGTLSVNDFDDCNYGAQVGRIGLGGMDLSHDESRLYVVNLYRNSLISVDADLPIYATAREFFIPTPICTGGEFRAFALKQYQGKIYVGGTCNAETSRSASDRSFHIYEFDPNTENFTHIFSTSYGKGYWIDFPSNTTKSSHWLTDIEFTDQGNMVLGISDRLAHRYCTTGSGQLNNQFPDILMVWNDNGTWRLESNGRAGTLSGTGIGNGQGPDGGEFFGEEYWVVGPSYHPEIAMGSVFNLPGQDEIVATVFDPHLQTYAGGLHRYNVTNGKKITHRQLYSGSSNPTFGKASGLGDMVALCNPMPIEIGNYVWYDANENGVQDPGEKPVDGLEISLVDEFCNIIATSVTNGAGEYYFNSGNVDSDLDGITDGLNYNTSYYLVITDERVEVSKAKISIGDDEWELTSINTGIGANEDYNDSDGYWVNTHSCTVLNGRPVIQVTTGFTGQNNHNFDLGLIPYTEDLPDPVFDLALRKTVVSAPLAKYGEDIEFEIEVFNQGEQDAQNIEITDYLSSAYEFNTDKNPGWELQGNSAIYKVSNTLVSGSSTKVPIIVTLKKNFAFPTLINYAEISYAENTDGIVPVDIDSKPDNDPTNDNGGQIDTQTDDLITDDGVIDEDDHDPAIVRIMDLALRKTTAQVDPVKLGQKVLFEIEVFNQGNVDAYDIKVVDYLPSSLALSADDDNGWTLSGTTAYVTIPGALPAGQSIVIEILVEVVGNEFGSMLINAAEITEVKDESGVSIADRDLDSTPNDVMDDDMGGDPFGPSDNVITDDGQIDEDDHDPAYVPVFDLALKKELAVQRSYKPGEDIPFNITVINQGGLPADEIDIVDYLPNGLSLSPNETEWSSLGNNLKYTHFGELAAGEQIVVPLLLIAEDTDEPKEFVNYAEILYAANAQVAMLDFDSQPDGIQSNDNGGEWLGATDNEVNDYGAIDEDDHDPAGVNIDPDVVIVLDTLDLALFKTTTATQLQAGDNVEFEINVINQGNVAVSYVELVDYIPFGLTLNDPMWSVHPAYPNGDRVTKILSVENGLMPSQGLQPGGMISQTIRLKIDDDALPGRFVNYAEIVRVNDMDGRDVSQDDIDSTPDMDPLNDAGGEPDSGSDNLVDDDGEMDEDDHDPALIVINSIERSVQCRCLNNESFPGGNGRFEEQILVFAPFGQTWSVENSEGAYTINSPAPPALPTPLSAGTVLATIDAGGGMAFYTLDFQIIDGEEYNITVINNFGERLSLKHISCHYSRPAIFGLNKICANGLQEYSADGNGSEYQWIVQGNGFIATNYGDKIDVQASGANGQTLTIYLREVTPDNCTDWASLEVILGEEDQAVTCLSEVNLALNADCDTEITPDMLLVGGPYDYSSYAVMLTDQWGQPIPGAIVGSQHIGQMITAKVINVCSGNSCWGKVFVEDKTPPVIHCLDDTLRCFAFENYRGPHVSDNCDPDPKIILLDEDVETLDCEQYIKRVTRIYKAVDNQGNESEECTQTILLRRIEIDSIDYPDDRSIQNQNPLICGTFEKDDNGNPHPSETGVPTLDGLDLYPYPDIYCNATVTYNDIVTPSTGCTQKILREWRVYEFWCGRPVIRGITQIIEITDNIAPQITCPTEEPTYTVDGRNCEATVLIEIPEVTDNCNEPVSMDVTYPGGFRKDVPGDFTVSLPVGENEIRFTAYDQCYNSSDCIVTIHVEDKTPPVAVCDQHTVVNIDNTGQTYIYAQTFDDGSFDGCFIDSMAVKRMDDGANCGFVADQFGPYVEFCCDDIGTSVMVLFKVWDYSGNANTCMVEVEVQDKIAPVITCPADATIYCTDVPERELLDSLFGRPTVVDNCGFMVEDTAIYDLNQCNVGTITRYFVASDNNGLDRCEQVITVEDPDPFVEGDIDWPDHYTTFDGCDVDNLHPDNLPAGFDRPSYFENECDLIGQAFRDWKYEFVPGADACFKILRQWEVIDWCQEDDQGLPLRWTYEQVIKVNDVQGPILDRPCTPIDTCTYDVECRDGLITLIQSATDLCTPSEELRWEWKIDEFRDGIFDHSDEGIGAIANASAEYPIGEHLIVWTFEDRCGNKTTCEQVFSVINCKEPTAYCTNGLSVSLIPWDVNGDGIPDTEKVKIWASDFDAGSEHPCGYPLKFSFGPDTANDCRVYDCDSLGRREVEICVTDCVNYRQSCCRTYIIIQDNNDVEICGDTNCIVWPEDSLIVVGCETSIHPDSLVSFPDTSGCMAYRSTITWIDSELPVPGNLIDCRRIKRTWTVELRNEDGDLVSTQMFMQIIKIRIDLSEDDIIWPLALVEIDDCTKSIDTADINHIPGLVREFCGLVKITFSDTDVTDPTTACLDVDRKWQVQSCCDTSQVFTFDQHIRVYNYTAPKLVCPPNVTVNADPDSCSAFVFMDTARVGDCSTGVTFTNTEGRGTNNADGRFPVGTTPVTFTATDKCGQRTSCTMFVTVRDDTPPMIICPSDRTLDCKTDYSNLSRIGGRPRIIENCDYELEVDSVFNLDDCNIGTITRTFIVHAVGDPSIADTCTQVITFRNTDPLEEGDITWGADTIEVFECTGNIDTSAINQVPTVSGEYCGEIEINFTDLDVSDPMDACKIIERTWTVTEGCIGSPVFDSLQIIIVYNDTTPKLTCPGDVTVNLDPDTCGAIVMLPDAFTSDCSKGVTITNDHIPAGGANASGFYPVGTTTVTFTATDSCGNVARCQTNVTVEDTISLSVTCPPDSTVMCETTFS